MHWKKKVMLRGRVDPDVFNKFTRRAKADGMKLQTALEHAARLWLDQSSEETRMPYPER